MIENENYRDLEDLFRKHPEIRQALEGTNALDKATDMTKYTGRTSSQIDIITKALDTRGSGSAKAKLEEVLHILNDAGIDVNVRTQKVGNNTMLQLVPLPYGDQDFYNKLGIKEQVWNLPIDTHGTIYFNNQQRNNLLQAATDGEGNLKLLGATEVALNNILQEFQYEKNIEAIKMIKSANKVQAAQGLKDLKRIMNTSTQNAINVGSAMSQYNASTMRDLEDAMKIEGSQQRQDVIKSGVYLGDLFKGILDKYYAGKGSFAEQAVKKDQATRLLNEMGLIVSASGVKKGYEIIKRNSKFKPILNDYRLAVPVLNTLGQLAKMDLVYGPVSDSNGLTMAYLNNVPHMLNFLLPKQSRKGYQTTLTEQNFFNDKNSKAFTKGAKFLTQREQSGLGVNPDSKAYDTTRFIQATQKELHDALEARVADLTKQRDAVDKALDPAAYNALSSRLKRAQKELVLSIQNGGIILDQERAQEIAASSVIAKSLANEAIKLKFEKLKAHNTSKLSDDALLKKAVRQAMQQHVSDLETYNPSADVLSFGSGLGRPTYNTKKKRYEDQIDAFVNDWLAGNIDKDSGVTSFGILQGYNGKHSAQSMKYVAPGTTVRATGTSINLNELLPYLARVRGHSDDFYMNKSITGIIDKEAVESKNVVNSAIGAMWDAYGRMLTEKNDKGEFIASDRTPAGFINEIKRRLTVKGSTALQDAWDALYKVGNGTVVEQSGPEAIAARGVFKKYFPAFMEAFSTAYNGTSAYKYTQNDKPISLNPEQWFNIINSGLQNTIGIENADDAFLSYMLMGHAGKKYGMPLSKGGMPVRYGYREFNSLMSLINLTEQLSDVDMGDLRKYYRDKSRDTEISRKRYDGMLEYHNMIQEMAEDIDTNESSIRARHGIIYDINDEFLKNINITKLAQDIKNGVYSEEIQSQDSKLPKLDKITGTLLYDIRKKQEEAFLNLSDVERQELIERAGGQAYIDQKVADLEKTDTYGNNKYTKEQLIKIAEMQAGAKYIPVAVKAGDNMMFPNNETAIANDFLLLPAFDFDIRKDAVGDVVNLGATGPGIYSFINNFVADLKNNGVAGTNRKEIATKAAEKVQELRDKELEQLTLKDSSTYDQATKVALGHSFQGKVIDFATIDYDKIMQRQAQAQQAGVPIDVNANLQAYTKNAIVVSRHMMNQLLSPAEGEVEGWSDQLMAYYMDIMGLTKEEVQAQMDTGLQKFVEENKDKEGFDKRLVRSQQGWLKNKIIDSITLGKGTDQSLSRGLAVLLNRYPSLLGDKDVLAAKLLVNPLWGKEKHSIVGGDESLIRLLNADFDGDTLVGALVGAGQLDKVKAMQDTVARLTAYERLFNEGRPKTPDKKTLEDLFPSEEDQARDVILTKTGKAYVGMFSNVRQGFMNAMHDKSSSWGTAEESKFSAASNLLGHFLSIFEQASISAKKMSADEAIGFESQLSDLYAAINDKNTWDSGAKVKNIIKKAQKAGIFKSGRLGLFGDDQAQTRLGILPIAEMLLLAEKFQDQTGYLNGLGSIFGLDGNTLKSILPDLKMNDQHEFIDPKKAEKALSNIKITENSIGNAVDYLNSALKKNPISILGENGKTIKAASLTDIWANKRAILPKAATIYKASENTFFNVGKAAGPNGRFTDEQIQKMIANGAIISDDGKTFWFTQDYLDSVSLKQQELELNEINKQATEQLFNRRSMGLNTMAAYKGFAAKGGSFDFDKSALTPTRILGNTLPYYYNKNHYDYEAQTRDIVDKNLDFGSLEAQKQYLNTFRIIEKGNIAHKIAQDLLESPAELMDIFSKGLFDTITDDEVTKLNEKIGTTLNTKWNKKPNQKDKEDHGGAGVQIKKYFDVMRRYNPTGVASDLLDAENDLKKLGLSLAVNTIRALGLTKTQGGRTTIDAKALKNAKFSSEVGLIGALTDYGRGYGRIDNSIFGWGRRDVGSTYWQSLAAEAAAYQWVPGDTENLSRDNLEKALASVDKSKLSKDEKQVLDKLQTQVKAEQTGRLIWSIGDIKTANKAGAPTGTNILQTMFYASMATGLQGILEETLTNQEKSVLRKIRTDTRTGKGHITQKNQKLLDSLFGAKGSFRGYTDGKSVGKGADIWEALYTLNGGDAKTVQEILTMAGLADDIEIFLNKGAMTGITEASRVDLKRAIQDPFVQEIFARMRKNPSSAIYKDEAEQIQALQHVQQYITSVSSQGSGTTTQLKAQQLAAHKAMVKYRNDALRMNALEDKKADHTITPEEQTELTQLRDNFFTNKGTNGILEALGIVRAGKFASQQDMIKSFTEIGLSDKDAGILVHSLMTDDFDTFKQRFNTVINSSTDNDWKQQHRQGTFGLNKWFKAQKENIKYQKALDELKIKQTGLAKNGRDTSEIDEQITALSDAIALNQVIIDREEAIYGDKSLGGDTTSFKTYKQKLKTIQALQKKQGVYDNLSDLQELYSQKSSLEQRYAIIDKQLNDENAILGPEERSRLELELNNIKNTLDTEINNYIDSYQKNIQKVLATKKGLTQAEKTRLQNILDNIQKSAPNAAYVDQTAEGLTKLGIAQGKTQRQSAAFKAYGGYYEALFNLDKNTESYNRTTDPTQRRLLQIEREELQARLEVAEQEKQNYELQSKHEGKDDQNALEEDKARLLYSERLKVLNNKPGVIDRFEGKIGATVAGLAKGYGLHMVLRRLIQSISKLIAQAIALDKVMANLRIVTGDSKTSTRALITEYANLGKAIGATTTEVASSAVEWLRQGYETAEVLDLVKSSMYLSKLGMMDASTATQSLTSALKGFKLQASESMDVVDKLTAIDMKAATSAGEIAQGLAQFANLGSLAGVNIDQAAAYVATISDVTQMSGSSAGQALKTIISRYGNVKAGAYGKLNVDSESSDESVNINDVERVLNKLGISIRKSNLEFKDFDEVLGEIAEKWGTLDRVSQKAVATAFAGIRQQEAFVTLLQNWDKYEDLLEVSENSKGTAEKKYGNAYQESFEAAKNSFTAALQDFMNRSEVNELLTKIVKFGTKLVELLPKLIKHLVNIFFTIQNFRALSGKSFIAKGLNKILGKDVFGRISDLPQGLNFGSKMRMFLRGEAGVLAKRLTSGGSNNTLTMRQKLQQRIRGFLGTGGQANNVNNTGAVVSTGLNMGTGAKNNTLVNSVFDSKLQYYSDLEKGTPSDHAKAYYQSKFNDTLAAKEKGDLSNLTATDIDRYNTQYANTAKENQLYRTRKIRAWGALLKNRDLKKASQIWNMQQPASVGSIGPGKASKALSPNTFRGKVSANFSKGVAKAGGGGAAAGAAVAGASIALNQVMAGWTAYQMIGQTHKNAEGKDVQSSEAARKQGGKIAQAWTTLVPVVGQIIGEAHAQKVMASIDRVKDSMDTLAEKSSKIVSAMKDISGSVNTLSDIASNDNFSSEKMREAIEAITSTLYNEDNQEARLKIQQKLGGETVYSLLDKYENGNEKERKDAARRLKIAQLQTENEANAKAREAALYKQQNTDISKNKYLAYRKGQKGYDSATGLSNEGKADALSGKNHGGTVAATVGGAAMMAVGTALMATGVGALLGAGLLAGGAVLSTVGSAAIGTKETEAAIAKKQEEEFQEWNAKNVFEKEEDLRNERNQILQDIDNKVEGAEARLTSVDEMLSVISDTTSMILQNIKTTNKERTREAIAQAQFIKDSQTNQWRLATEEERLAGVGSFIDELSDEQKKNIGASTIIKLVADQLLESGALQGYYTFTDKDNPAGDVTEYAKQMIESELSAADEGFEKVLSGKAYTLSETLRQDAADEYVQRRLQNFANALGVSVDELASMESSQGMLKLSEILQSTTEDVTSIEEYGSLMSEIADSTKSATKWMSELVSKYPELIAYMSDTPRLMEQIMKKIGGLIEAGFNSQFSELMNSSAFYEELKTKDDVGYATIKSGINKIRETDAKKAQDIEDLIETIGAENLQKLWDRVLGYDESVSGVTELKQIIKEVGDEYNIVSDAYKEFLQRYAETQSKELEKQLSNLEAQKSALQEINKQREYQNQLIEAQLRLDNALNEKQRVYRAGVGFVYEADQGAIAKAQEDLENVQQNKQISMLEQQTNILQTIKDQWDNMYAEQTLELQRKESEAFEEYILKSGEGGFQNNMTGLASASAATQGSVKKLSDMLEDKFGTQEEQANKAVDEAAKLLLEYENTGTADALLKYQKQAKKAESLGGTMNQIQAAAINQYQGNKDQYSNISYSETEGLTSTFGKQPGEKASVINAGSAKTQTTGLEKYDATVYNLGDKGDWVRTLYDSEQNEATSIANWIVQDIFQDHGGGADAWSGGNGFQTEENAIAFVLNADGTVNHYNLKEVAGYKGRNMWKDYKNLRTPEKLFKQLSQDVSLTSGQQLIIGGMLGGHEYVLVNSDGSYTALKVAKNVGTDWVSGGLVHSDTAKEHKYGTLGINGIQTSLINELGTEAIITPSGTITALPSRTGIVPADITKNLWALGEVAPAILRLIGPSIMPDHIGSSQADVVDESFNINSLTMNVTADGSFDAEAFVDSIKTRANLTKNMRRS